MATAIYDFTSIRSDIECDLIEDPFLHERRDKGSGLCVLDTRFEAVQQRLVHLERLGTVGSVALKVNRKIRQLKFWLIALFLHVANKCRPS